ncbi:MAG: methylated-DNA--[protein]-cysteine S-methyltransferase [Intestinibacter sp.]|uniref:methylated-DNA--[protein]-cysteine S-methyltransferase n=1 Tax=Intestinibacter sp. TaxID=1965304 RepID=UPI0025C152F6|nr:methylated-DNA--[protein]-cysteine S-methyltransferase [Intestinibacter sp.]MCI6737641.1 methylated-DNA--[protein]-cysteine S-methyltransferase [Intestinibacter sp.]
MDRLFYYDTKIGRLGIREDGESITHIYFREPNVEVEIEQNRLLLEESDLIKMAYIQLSEYIEGQRKQFDLPLDPKGTEFQRKVWKELTKIPYGETRSYKEVAIAIGNEKASRAIGMANNKNPIPIVIPCHRVVGSNKKLVGYAGGLDLKEKLLNLEGILVDKNKVNK